MHSACVLDLKHAHIVFGKRHQLLTNLFFVEEKTPHGKF